MRPIRRRPKVLILPKLMFLRGHTPLIAGRKIYPDSRLAATNKTEDVANAYTLANPPLLPGNVQSKKTHTRINALPAGTRFRTRLRFHNLKPAELGALLFVLCCGNPRLSAGKPFVDIDNGKLRSSTERTLRLGGGKPIGLGHVSTRITDIQIAANAVNETAPQLENCWNAFSALVRETFPKENHQLYAFLWSTDPSRNKGLRLIYMPLERGPESYVEDKKTGHFLPTYTMEIQANARRTLDD